MFEDVEHHDEIGDRPPGERVDTADDAGAHGIPSVLARQWITAAALFLASAAFVLWRNSEVAVLVDIAYPLNTATRIALGEVPYAQFPLAQAPGEFLVQAMLIKLFGAQYVVQIAYAAIVGGIATVLTSAIAARLLAGALPLPRLFAAVLAIALVPLGVYAIYPHPFYDSDACVLMLAALAATLVALDVRTRSRAVLAGVLLVIPLFMKQNAGGAFLVLMVASLALHAWSRRDARRVVRWITLAAASALLVEVVVLQLVVGVDNYVRWAWTFALAGRGVTLERLQEFAAPVLLVVLITLILRRVDPGRRVAIVAAALAVLLIVDVDKVALLIFAPG